MKDDDARLIEIAAETSRLAAEAAAIIARRSCTPAAPSTPARRTGRLIDVSQAAKIAARGSSWVYRHGPRHDFAWRLKSGSWVVDESLLRLFLAGRDEKNEHDEKNEAPMIPLLSEPD